MYFPLRSEVRVKVKGVGTVWDSYQLDGPEWVASVPPRQYSLSLPVTLKPSTIPRMHNLYKSMRVGIGAYS
jgi:hypothetical protein